MSEIARKTGKRRPESPRRPAQSLAVGNVAPARAVAAHLLLLVERGTAHSDDQLRSPRAGALTRQDRDLMTELVLGTLRWERVLDAEIAARLSRPDAEMHYGVIVALRLGAYQLLFLDRIPAHAAIGESVELAKQADGQHAAGMVNAVLRRLAREQRPGVRAARDPVAAHPEWMIERWRVRFGLERTARLCAFNQAPAPSTLRLTDEADEGLLAASGVELAPGEFLGGARRLVGGDVTGSPLLAQGRIRLQDEASQLVGELAALLPASAQSAQVLDACAAPGGKTAILLERLPLAQVTAMDVSESRLRIMRQRMADSMRLRTVVGDAALLSPQPLYDAILCDVPCSGTGTLARNPEIRHRLDPGSFARHHARQARILAAALGALKPRGRLMYSTCSLEPEEDELVVESVIRNRSGYKVLPVAAEIAKLASTGIVSAAGLTALMATAVRGPYLATLPGVHSCDGFFAAMIVRD